MDTVHGARCTVQGTRYLVCEIKGLVEAFISLKSGGKREGYLHQTPFSVLVAHWRISRMNTTFILTLGYK